MYSPVSLNLLRFVKGGKSSFVAQRKNVCNSLTSGPKYVQPNVSKMLGISLLKVDSLEGSKLKKR